MSDTSAIDGLIDDFSYLEDWEDRYAHVLELGKSLAPLNEAEHNTESHVEGCVSRVWLIKEPQSQGDDPVLSFRGDSDSLIVKGLIAIVLMVFSNRSASEILELNAQEVFDALGLNQHLTQQRANGLAAMVRRIKAEAAAAQSS